MGFCKYRHAFGQEGKGVHTHVFGVAMFDVLGTVAGAWILSKLLKRSFVVVFLVLMLIAIVAHRLFCVNTTINKLIFGTV